MTPELMKDLPASMTEVAKLAQEMAAPDEEEIVVLSPTIKLNEEQEAAVVAMLQHLAKDRHDDYFFVLRGPAGTGKTTCTREVAQRYDGRIAFTAPTNKAVKVLREGLKGISNVQCATIFSLLGLKLEANGMIKQLAIPDETIDIKDFDAVVVDEGSMINRELLGIIKEVQRSNGVPFIFMGDPAQLPPVKEKHSPIWELENVVSLTKVMRHDNQILKLATHLREKVDLPFPNLRIRPDNDGEEGVWLMSDPVFEGGILKHASAGNFHSGATKAIAWRNVTVNRLNLIVREQTLGDTPLPFAKGDRIIAKSPCYDNKDLLLHTDEEGEVLEVQESENRWFPQFQTIRIKLRPDGKDRPLWVWTVHPQIADQLTKELKQLAEKAQKDRYLWRDYWKLRESFHDVGLAYAVTAHRSQGSTYTSTFVDMQDILCNPNKSEAMRCLYVACTRARKQLFLKGSN